MSSSLPPPPKLALEIFRWYCRTDRQEELEGDLEEFYYRRLKSGDAPWKARFFFWWNVIRCYRSYAKQKTQNTMIIVPLFKSYFKLAIRHSWKNKWSVLINIVGLGVALSMCIFLYSIYAYNLEFDTYYKNTDDVYRLHSMTFENGQTRRNEISPMALDDKLRNEVGGLQEVVTYCDYQVSVRTGNEFFTETVAFTSPNFFDMFEVPLWYGSYSAFGEQPVAYLSKETAKKYFGEDLALEKELTLYIAGDNKREVIVAGVFENVPENTSFDAQIFVRFEEYKEALDFDPNDWSNKRYVAHFVRASAQQMPSVTEQLSRYIPLQNEGNEQRKITDFELVPFLSPLVANHIMWRSFTSSRLRPSVYVIFTTLIAMVFLIACFNLANTQIAMTAKRLKEIGIRKTLGSEGNQILFQFLFEMGIVCSLAFIVALSLANTTSKAILGLFGASFLLQDANLTGVTLFILVFLVFTTLVAGFLPALYAWKFQPVAIMRKSVRLRGVSWLNKTLTVAQMAFSIAVLTAGITFSQNKGFLDNLELGYEDDGIYTVRFTENKQYAPFKQQVEQLSGIRCAGTRDNIGSRGDATPAVMKIDTSTYEIGNFIVGEEYLHLVALEITTGRGFIKGSTNDMERSILVNESFAKQYFDGRSPIGEVITVDQRRRSIVGVTADVIVDLYSDSEMTPAIFSLGNDDDMYQLVIKTPPSQMVALEADLKSIWTDLFDLPFEGRSQGDIALGQAKQDSDNLQQIFMAMALLGSLLSLVGIFSLAKLNVARKLKEISIRKVLGATVQQLLVTINRGFTVTLAVSFVVGSALGFIVSQTVLDLIYKYHIDVTPAPSVVNGLFIILFSTLMITLAVYLPARGNPVNGLREE